jgi:pimeloyl-ACP methyl ester carboxylesterase
VTGAMHSAFEWYRAFPADIRKNHQQLERKLPMPVLMMGGAQSGGPLMQATGEEIAEVFTVKVIENCGHWLMDEHPREVLSALIVFLESNKGLHKT